MADHGLNMKWALHKMRLKDRHVGIFLIVENKRLLFMKRIKEYNLPSEERSLYIGQRKYFVYIYLLFTVFKGF